MVKHTKMRMSDDILKTMPVEYGSEALMGLHLTLMLYYYFEVFKSSHSEIVELYHEVSEVFGLDEALDIQVTPNDDVDTKVMTVLDVSAAVVSFINEGEGVCWYFVADDDSVGRSIVSVSDDGVDVLRDDEVSGSEFFGWVSFLYDSFAYRFNRAVDSLEAGGGSRESGSGRGRGRGSLVGKCVSYFKKYLKTFFVKNNHK